jgi:glycosyltransferase involved in cell wall biosynthesis
MARIAILLPALGSGGAERVMLNLARGLVERGCEVDMLLVRAEGAFLPDLDPRVRLVDLGARRALAAFPALLRTLRRERPQALLSNLPYLNLLSVPARRLGSPGTRLVLIEHNDLARSTAHGVRRWERLFPLAARLLYPRADRVVAVSQGVADGLVRLAGLHREKMDVIYNPILSPDLESLAAADPGHPWFAPGEPPVVLAVGRLTAQKDYPTLLRAFAQLRANRPARLLVLGEGELLDELGALARSLGIAADVQFAGFDANPYRFMKRSAVLALSSAWEGFGNVLVEALACGTQVVSTDCPSGPAEILAGGEFGRLVPVGDAAALAEALGEALDRPIPPESLRRRAADFSVAAAVERYIPLLTGEQP